MQRQATESSSLRVPSSLFWSRCAPSPHTLLDIQQVRRHSVIICWTVTDWMEEGGRLEAGVVPGVQKVHQGTPYIVY